MTSKSPCPEAERLACEHAAAVRAFAALAGTITNAVWTPEFSEAVRRCDEAHETSAKARIALQAHQEACPACRNGQPV